MIWAHNGEREEGAWYWVTDGKSVWLAIYDPDAAGGWTNQDTWEDFEGKVFAWGKADVPTPPTEQELMEFVKHQ